MDDDPASWMWAQLLGPSVGVPGWSPSAGSASRWHLPLGKQRPQWQITQEPQVCRLGHLTAVLPAQNVALLPAQPKSEVLPGSRYQQ